MNYLKSAFWLGSLTDWLVQHPYVSLKVDPHYSRVVLSFFLVIGLVFLSKVIEMDGKVGKSTYRLKRGHLCTQSQTWQIWLCFSWDLFGCYMVLPDLNVCKFFILPSQLYYDILYWWLQAGVFRSGLQVQACLQSRREIKSKCSSPHWQRHGGECLCFLKVPFSMRTMEV